MIGPNGAGKSTLFLTAAGLLAPDAGTVLVRGCPAGTPGAQRALSLTPEQPDLYPGVLATTAFCVRRTVHTIWPKETS